MLRRPQTSRPIGIMPAAELVALVGMQRTSSEQEFAGYLQMAGDPSAELRPRWDEEPNPLSQRRGACHKPQPPCETAFPHPGFCA